MTFIGPCMCRCVVSCWEEEYPFIRQGVMHSPVGCIRRELSESELRSLYKALTGFEFGNPSFRALFQSVISYLVVNPEVAKQLPSLVLTPVSVLPQQEKPRISNENTGESTRVGVASKQPPAKKEKVVINPGPIKPPWLK